MILKVLVNEHIVVEAFVVVAFEDCSGIRPFFDFVDFDGNLGIFGSLFFLDLRIITNRSCYHRLESGIDCILLFLHDLTGHTHRQLLVRLLKSGYFHTGLGNFFIEIFLNIVTSLRVIFNQFSIEHDELGQ